MSHNTAMESGPIRLRILQIVSALDAGGAERMAVSYANALASRVELSGLVSTRSEGLLKGMIGPGVQYFFLKRRSTLDVRAVLRLRMICKVNKIDVLHAHADSFFIATLVKVLYPKVRIIWHDHYGLSEFLEDRKSATLKIASYFFSGIIAVNSQLKQWAERVLSCKRVIYFPNFASPVVAGHNETELLGKHGAKVLCLANLRPQKNHFFLLEVAKRVLQNHPDCSFHLVGQDFVDEYSRDLRMKIAQEGLENNVFVYGSRADTQNIIGQSDIGILTSKSEGLPVSLLEYGLQAKPVVMTAVGEIPQIIRDGENGFLVDRDDVEGFAEGLSRLISDAALKKEFGDALAQTVASQYSEQAVLRSYLEWISHDSDRIV